MFSNLIGLLSLMLVEMIMAVDNALVIIVVCSGLVAARQKYWQRRALLEGAAIRVVALSFLAFLAAMQKPMAWAQSLFGIELSVAQIVFFVGGVFLMYLSAKHVFEHVTGKDSSHRKIQDERALWWSLFWINVVFSADSVLSAVGMVKHVWIMVVAVMFAAVIMLTQVERLAKLFQAFPNFVDCGLVVVFVVGVKLLLEAFHLHWIDNKVLYFMLFGMFLDEALSAVELYRQRTRGVKNPKVDGIRHALSVFGVLTLVSIILRVFGNSAITTGMLAGLFIGTLTDECVTKARQIFGGGCHKACPQPAH